MSFRDLRFWTALGVAILAVVTMRGAWSVMGFGIAHAFATQGNAKIVLESYIERPGVAGEARKAMLRIAPPADDTSLVDDLDGMLTRAPINSATWLDLAGARLAVGDGPARVASALAISNVTGPNESWLMAGRATFGLPLWEVLPPDLRRNVIADLVSGWPYLERPAQQSLSKSLSALSPPTIEQIRAALLLAGKSGTPVIVGLKLAQPGMPVGR